MMEEEVCESGPRWRGRRGIGLCCLSDPKSQSISLSLAVKQAQAYERERTQGRTRHVLNTLRGNLQPLQNLHNTS